MKEKDLEIQVEIEMMKEKEIGKKEAQIEKMKL